MSDQTDLQNALNAKANVSSLNSIATKGIQSSNDNILIDSTTTPIDLILNGQQSFQCSTEVGGANITGRVSCNDYSGQQSATNPLIVECVTEGIEGGALEGLFRDSSLNVNLNGFSVSIENDTPDGAGYSEGIYINMHKLRSPILDCVFC